MAGIPWGKYDRADWRRSPGASRRYYLVSHPNTTISRRQYDEHYGAARPYGTYEKKAKLKSQEREAILRPARGRTSALKLKESEKEAEIGRRRVVSKDAATQKRIDRERSKAHKYPRSVDLRTFKKGKISRTIELPVMYAAVESVRAAAAKSRIVFGYYVGANMIDIKSGERISFAAFSLRDINMVFKPADFDKLIKKAQEKTYAELISLWIHIKLKSAVAIDRNGWKKKH